MTLANASKLLIDTGEAVGGEDAERLAAGLPASKAKPEAAKEQGNVKDDDGESASQRN